MRSTDGRVRLNTLPKDLPWSTIGQRLVCKECGVAGSVHIVPNWHDRAGHAVPFTRHWKTSDPALKLTADRPFADPDKAARRLLEHAHAFEPIQDGRIYIEKLNSSFLYIDRDSAAEYSAGLKLAVERGWLEMHDSGTYVKFTAAGADLFRLMADNGYPGGILFPTNGNGSSCFQSLTARKELRTGLVLSPKG